MNFFLHSNKVLAHSEIGSCEMTKLTPPINSYLEAEFANFNPNQTPRGLFLLRIGDKLWTPSCANKFHRTNHFCDTKCTTQCTHYSLTNPLFYTLLLLYYATTPILYNNTSKTNVICQKFIQCKMHKMIKTLCIIEHAQHAEMCIIFFLFPIERCKPILLC